MKGNVWMWWLFIEIYIYIKYANIKCNVRYTFILQAYGHFQEAAVHLRHALELKPDLSDAADALKEVESLPLASMHVYTLLIIVGLVRKLMKQISIQIIYSLWVSTIK